VFVGAKSSFVCGSVCVCVCVYDVLFLEIGWADSLAVFFKVVANNPGRVVTGVGLFQTFQTFRGWAKKVSKSSKKFNFFKTFLLFAQNIKKMLFSDF
jgi:hypothetical protein